MTSAVSPISPASSSSQAIASSLIERPPIQPRICGIAITP